MRYHGNKICPDERRTNERTTENITPSPTLSGEEDVKIIRDDDKNNGWCTVCKVYERVYHKIVSCFQKLQS